MPSYRFFLKKYFLILLLALLPACLLVEPSYSPQKLHKFAHLMPKPSLHIHLEGSIPPATMLDLAKKNNISFPLKNESEFRKTCDYASFEEFVTLFKQIIGCLKTPEDYERIAYEFGKDCARQNICYAEVTFSMATNCMLSGLDWQTILTALNKGRDRAAQEFGITWRWMFDLTRTQFFEPEEFLNRLIESRSSGQGVVAMGLSETLITHRVAEYQHIFDKAIAAKLPIIPHAGEFEGPQSIWNSIRACEAPRIGHGVRCIEDPELVKTLIQKQIALEINITSNICLGVYPSYREHPIRKLWDAGVFITVNADDPTLFNSDINQEYDHLIDDYHFTLDDLEKVSLNGIKASLLSSPEKESFVKKFKAKFALLRRKIF